MLETSARLKSVFVLRLDQLCTILQDAFCYDPLMLLSGDGPASAELFQDFEVCCPKAASRDDPQP